MDADHRAKVSASAREPAIYVAKFSAPGIDWANAHTFLDSRGWGHGIALVNGFNLGRYWPLQGPQVGIIQETDQTRYSKSLSSRISQIYPD